MTMSAARGGAVPEIGELRWLIEKRLYVRNLCIAAAAHHEGPDPRDSRFGSSSSVAPRAPGSIGAKTI